jgi:hypothetical protein
MSGLNGVLSLLGDAAKELLPLVVPGSGAVIAGAGALTDAYNSLKSANGGQAPADAEASHDALFAKVEAHADSTFGRMEGG